MRFCVDYRRLNAITKRDVYPLPRMDDCLESLGGATVFSTIDNNCGYWQLGIDKCDKLKRPLPLIAARTSLLECPLDFLTRRIHFNVRSM